MIRLCGMVYVLQAKPDLSVRVSVNKAHLTFYRSVAQSSSWAAFLRIGKAGLHRQQSKVVTRRQTLRICTSSGN